MERTSEIDLARIVWNITNKCNFSCSFCYTNSNPNKQYGLETASLLKIVNEINETNVSVVSLIGGEPLLRKDIALIIESFKDTIYLKLDTNGSLLLKNWCNAFDKINSFSIGLEGENIINEMERKSTNLVLKSISFLLNKNKTVNVPILINKNNFKAIKRSLNFILGLGINRVQINKFIPVIGRNNSYLSLTDDEENYVINSIIELIEEKPEIKNIISLNGFKSYLYFNNLKTKQDNLPNCKCGDFSAAISYDGYFVPCTVLSTEQTIPKLKKKYIIPNLITDSIKDSYEKSSLFKDFRRNTSFLSNECLNCKFNYYCNHGCRGYTLIATEDIFSHDPTCNLH